jgi:hydrogenase nickel incorporation protein HypA/HybF
VHCDALRFGFQLLSQGTSLEGVELSIRQPAAVSRCRACETSAEIDEMVVACPRCGSLDIVIEKGRELMLETIEIED